MEPHADPLPEPKRFFRIDEDDGDGPHWIVVARNREHAEEIMDGFEFGDPSQPFAEATKNGVLTWHEIKAERAQAMKVRDEGDVVLPLSECQLGDYFCSEC